MPDEPKTKSTPTPKRIVAALAMVMALIGGAIALRIVINPHDPVDVKFGVDGISAKFNPSNEGGQNHSRTENSGSKSTNSSQTGKDGSPSSASPTVVLPGSKFPKLAYPQGYIYYEVDVDGMATSAGSLGRQRDDEYPPAESIKAGEILISSNAKSFRTRPFGAAIGQQVGANTCFRIIDGQRKKIPAPPPVSSAAWLPAEVTDCPA